VRTRLFSLLELRITKAILEYEESMGRGTCADYPQYKENCGYIRGLREAMNLMEEIEKGEE